MSSYYVRNLAAQWALNCITPFYETVNTEQNPLDDQWLTLEYIVFETATDTFCLDTEETGTIRMVFFGKPGTGFQALMQMAEADANTFFNNVDPSNALTMELKNAPIEFGGSDTPFFGIEISIDYSYRS